MKQLVEQYNPKWLPPNWANIELKTIEGKEGKKQGQYHPVRNVIELAPDAPAVLFGSYVHELYHASQRYRFGLILYWLLLGLLRPLMERGAVREELKAVEWHCAQKEQGVIK